MNIQFLNKKIPTITGILIIILCISLVGIIIVWQNLKMDEESQITREFIPTRNNKISEEKALEELLIGQRPFESMEEEEKKEEEKNAEKETAPNPKPQILLSPGTSEKLSSEPIVMINVHFELATEDIDLTSLKADNDFAQGKSFFYAASWPSVIEDEKILFIPSPRQSGVIYICPNVTSLEEISLDCQNKIEIKIGETLKGMFINLTDYEGKLYYIVYGITGNAGGGEK